METEQVSGTSEGAVGPVLIEILLAETAVKRVREAGFVDVELSAYLSRPVEMRGSGMGNRLKIAMPPRQWDRLAVACRANLYVNPGASRTEEFQARAAKAILERIEKVVGSLAKHPGYRGRGIKGTSSVALPAFRCKGQPKARWWPLPSLAVANATGDDLFPAEAVLVPNTRMVRGTLVTTWHPSGVGELEPSDA